MNGLARNRNRLYLLCCVGMLFVTGCSPTPEEEAKQSLEQLDVAYTAQAFIRSIQNQDKKQVQLFLQAGMDPDEKVLVQTGGYLYPLLEAVRAGSVGVVTTLLQAGANANVRDLNLKESALEIAVHQGMENIAIALLEHGAEAEAKLLQVASHIRPDRDAGSQMRLFRALLAHGADPMEKMPGGGNALFAVAAHGNREAAQVLLDEKQVPIDSTNDLGETPLFTSIRNEQVDMVALLLAKGANPQHKSNDGLLPVQLAQLADPVHAKIRTLLLVK